jgi:hypothetical protein
MQALLIVTCCAGLLTFGWFHHSEMKAESARLESSISEMVYVMTLTDEERAKLHLSMPESLRQRVHGRSSE